MYRVIAFLLFLPFLYAQPPGPSRFAVIGDMGSGSKAQQLVADQMWNWMQQHPFQVVLMLGDNIYGGTELTGGGNPRLFHREFDLEYHVQFILSGHNHFYARMKPVDGMMTATAGSGEPLKNFRKSANSCWGSHSTPCAPELYSPYLKF